MSYSKELPFLAQVKENIRLNKTPSNKNIHHIVLDLSQSDIKYKVGDCLAILPHNDSQSIESILKSLKAKGGEPITPKKSETATTLQDFLNRKANIANINKGLIREVADKHENPDKKAFLNTLLQPENKEALKKHIEDREVWDFLEEHTEAKLNPEDLCQHLRPLMPRFYSIASSMNSVGDEVHLTVASVNYESNGHKREGVASTFLCLKDDKNDPDIPVYIHPTKDFTLPEDPQSPIIMVGPGTGIAPFRGFIQERLSRSHTGKNWLFFGSRHRDQDFLYGDYWLSLQERGLLELDLAFSRDQEEKVYVQDKMREKAALLWQWLEEGAYFYVCGDAKCMARDVDKVLLKIVENEGKLSLDDAKAYIKKLKSENRYLRDVY